MKINVKYFLFVYMVFLISNTYSQQEYRYYTIGIGHPSYSKKNKTVIITKPKKIVMPNEVIKQDLKKQFFYHLYDNYNALLKRFKYTGVDQFPSRYSSFIIWFGKTEEESFKKIKKFYGIKQGTNSKKDYDVKIVDDFNFKLNKFTHPNYTHKQIFALYNEINNYLSKGIEINRN